MDAMTELEGSLAPLPPPPAPEPPLMEESDEVLPFDVDASKPMKPENAVYLVFFNWDSSEIGASAQSVLDAVAEEIKKNPPQSVNVTGHTDTSGSDAYNQRLAFKRANIVKDALVKMGIEATMMNVDAKGESELMVPTPDNVREPANRRVNITFN